MEPPSLDWSCALGPRFTNAIATLELTSRRAEAWLELSEPDGFVEYARLPLTG